MKSRNKKVIVRMAPSPTGSFHIGTARTALFNYIFAKQKKGKFILRMDNTDEERSTKEFEDNILGSFSWLNFEYDELYHQSDRKELYKSYLKKMLSNGSAYLSKEESKEEGQRLEVIRFENPNEKVVFEDIIRGQVEFDTTDLGDFIVAKSVEEPLYHLASVVDDLEMKVTHVIRGEDGLSNTPRQILIQRAIGAPRPLYAHLPLILATDKSKLSKRKHGESVSLDYYRQKGYLPEAVINYLALLGWNPGTNKEIFTLEELIKEFDISQVHKGGAIFDEKKLEWVNKQHINLLSPGEKLKIIAKDFDAKIIPKLDRAKIWKGIGAEETLNYLLKAIEII